MRQEQAAALATRSTHRIADVTYALRARGGKVGRDDPLNPDGVRRANEVALRGDLARADGADEDRDPGEHALEPLDAVVEVPDADFHAVGLEVAHAGFGERRGADHSCDALWTPIVPDRWLVRCREL